MEGKEGNYSINYDNEGRPYFITPDSYTAAHLKDSGYTFELMSENGVRFDFRFPVSEGLLKALYEYQSGKAVVNALQFSRTIKAVRGEILKRRDNQNGNTKNYRVTG